MDAQMKKGMVDVCILAVLARGDSYGYQLRRLESAGCLTVYSVEHNSRLRKYYAITDEGRRKIADFLGEWAEIKKVYDFIAEGSNHEKQE